MSKLANDLEKKIKGKINAIARGTITTKEAGVNSLMAKLKEIDEVSAGDLQKEYIEAVKAAAKK